MIAPEVGIGIGAAGMLFLLLGALVALADAQPRPWWMMGCGVVLALAGTFIAAGAA